MEPHKCEVTKDPDADAASWRATGWKLAFRNTRNPGNATTLSMTV